jgi:hypothetical protein
MGEIADDVYCGFLCQMCLCMIDEDAPGYPRTCKDCQPRKRKRRKKRKGKKKEPTP